MYHGRDLFKKTGRGLEGEKYSRYYKNPYTDFTSSLTLFSLQYWGGDNDRNIRDTGLPKELQSYTHGRRHYIHYSATCCGRPFIQP